VTPTLRPLFCDPCRDEKSLRWAILPLALVIKNYTYPEQTPTSRRSRGDSVRAASWRIGLRRRPRSAGRDGDSAPGPGAACNPHPAAGVEGSSDQSPSRRVTTELFRGPSHGIRGRRLLAGPRLPEANPHIEGLPGWSIA
jgi:hypothetical protein